MAIVMAIILPLVAAVSGKPQNPDGAGLDQSVRDAVGEALQHRGFVLLVIGFLVCGFQTMFIGARQWQNWTIAIMKIIVIIIFQNSKLILFSKG